MANRSDDELARLGIQVDLGSGADAEAVADATLRLRRELLDLDVDAVDLASGGPPPPGTRAGELAALGGLVVTIANTGVLGTVVGALRSWLASQPQRSIKLELDGDVLELTGVSSDEQRRLADAWLRRQAKR